MMDKYGEHFTNDYIKNKEMVNRYLETNSKKIRNIVAGYTTRLAKK